jgi:DNA polymerase-4
MGAQRALGRGRWSAAEQDAVLLGLVERVTRRMRAAGRVGRTVTLRLRFADYADATRSHTLAMPTSATAEVFTSARVLLARSAPLVGRRGLTLLGVAVGNLTAADQAQLALPFGEPPSLDSVVDRVRDRFGSSAVSRGVLVGRGQGWEMPLLPD